MKVSYIVGVAVLLAAAPAIAATALTPVEIKATFGTGKAFTATSSGGQAYSFVFKPDGSATQSPKGSTTTITTGTWRVNDKGYCSRWGTNAEHCYTIEKNGDKFDVRDSTGKAISRWSVLP
jgi:hypothetical protein